MSLVALAYYPAVFAQNDSLPASRVEFSPIVQVFGLASYDLNKEQYAFTFNRAHIGLKMNHGKRWSSKIILDHGRPTVINGISFTDSLGIGNPLNVNQSKGAHYSTYLKFASIRWQVRPQLSIEGGSVLQNHYIVQENFWGLRYIAQTFQDMYWRIPSSDLGFIGFYQPNARHTIDLALTNGEGPRIAQDSEGKVKLALGYTWQASETLTLRTYAHSRLTSLEGQANETLLSFFSGIKLSKDARIGLEINRMDNLDNTREMLSWGYSVFGVFKALSGLEGYARIDCLKNNPPESQELTLFPDGYTLIIGVSYAPVVGIRLSLGYQGWLPEKNKGENVNQIRFSTEFKI